MRLLDKYLLSKEIGRGQFGITYLYTDKKIQEVFACKSILRNELKTLVDENYMWREVAIMQHLHRHSNVVIRKATYEDDSSVYLVMELCEGGDLHDCIIAKK